MPGNPEPTSSAWLSSESTVHPEPPLLLPTLLQSLTPSVGSPLSAAQDPLGMRCLVLRDSNALTSCVRTLKVGTAGSRLLSQLFYLLAGTPNDTALP